jgi:transposase-like protein
MMTFNEFMATFPDETACRQYLVDRRWPKDVTCPRCDNEKVYTSKARPFHWQCMKCGPGPRKPYRFSVLVATVFENTNVPLLTWFKVLYTMLQAKKGVSSLQIRRMFFGERSSTHTAWYVCHRLRAGMRDEDFRKLMGIVEVDETYVGGKNKHRDKRFGRGAAGKMAVLGAISRKGNVVAAVTEKLDAETMTRFVRNAVSDKVSLIATDEHPSYVDLKKFYNHQAVDHSKEEYVRGLVHTANIDSFWSLLKRGIMGSFHHVSKKYLPLYVNEFQFRFNNRKNPDIFGLAVAGC